jgi:hypothetical protein
MPFSIMSRAQSFKKRYWLQPGLFHSLAFLTIIFFVAFTSELQNNPSFSIAASEMDAILLRRLMSLRLL